MNLHKIKINQLKAIKRDTDTPANTIIKWFIGYSSKGDITETIYVLELLLEILQFSTLTFTSSQIIFLQS